MPLTINIVDLVGKVFNFEKISIHAIYKLSTRRLGVYFHSSMHSLCDVSFSLFGSVHFLLLTAVMLLGDLALLMFL